jgi:phospholipid/cholesterol/gamma-HCH transport system ATP-binding protein
MSVEEKVLVLENLGKSFGSNKVLNGVSIDLVKGENLVILGKSGSGKSVLIKCIVKLIDNDEGTINVFGTSLDEVSPADLNKMRARIGFLFQGGALYDSMSVRENLEFPLVRHHRDLDQDAIDDKVSTALENVGLLDAADKLPAELSGGMRKRIGLARTLILNPEIMLYDEPTTGLDPVTSNEISELILEMQKKYQTSSIIITHDMNCAKLTSNRIAMIRDGKIYETGTFDELKSKEDPWIKSFFI